MGRTAISTQKPIQLILARQLASSLAMPVIIVDTLATVVYYNEPAETLIARRFEEHGEMVAEVWAKDFDVNDEHRQPMDRNDWPLVVALQQRRPVSQLIWLMSPDGTWRKLHWNSIPLDADTGQFLGVLNIFWEPHG